MLSTLAGRMFLEASSGLLLEFTGWKSTTCLLAWRNEIAMIGLDQS